jgi:hypothetical protein
VTTSDGLPVKFRDLPSSAYPFTVEFFQVGAPPGSGPLETIRVEGIGAILVRGCGSLGIKVWVRITWADGDVTEEGPPDGTPWP